MTKTDGRGWKARCLRFAKALLDVMDSMADHDIQAETGLPLEDCTRIAKAREDARQLLSKHGSAAQDKMMEYQIFTREYTNVLEVDVNAALADGWQLVGGLSAVSGNGFFEYSQAMIRHHVTPTESEQNA